MSQSINSVTEAALKPNETYSNSSVTAAAYAANIEAIGNLHEKGLKGMSEAEQMQEKIKFLQSIKHEINIELDSKKDTAGKINFKDNTELQSKLRYAKEELGLKLKLNSPDQVEFEAHECSRIVEQAGDLIDNLKSEYNRKLQEVSTIQRHMDQWMITVKEMQNKESKVIDGILRDMKR